MPRPAPRASVGQARPVPTCSWQDRHERRTPATQHKRSTADLAARHRARRGCSGLLVLRDGRLVACTPARLVAEQLKPDTAACALQGCSDGFAQLTQAPGRLDAFGFAVYTLLLPRVMLAMFGRVDALNGASMARVVTLAFPTSIAAALGRLLI